jgi:endonuclease-3
MAARSRSSLIAKLNKVLKAHYKPVEANGDRPLLEHMLFACCLENAPYQRAEKTFQSLATSFFDWNEVRVSTVKELSEAMRDLPDPAAAAANLKRVLQTVFESTYSFDLETVKKQNIGAGIKKLAKMEGASPFVVAYATQHGLGGHYIPLDRGALEVLYIVGIGTEAERDSGAVAGLERAIPKNKGVVFGSLLHQLAAEFIANPHSTNVRNLLLSINPDAKNRFPKRGQKKEEPAVPVAAAKGAKLPAVAKPLAGKPGAKEAQLDKAHHRAAELQNGSKQAAQKLAAQQKKPLPAKPSAIPAEKPRKHAPAMAGAGRAVARKSSGRQLAKRKPR